MADEQHQSIVSNVRGRLQSGHSSFNSPSPRINPLTIIYKNMLFVAGGRTTSQHHSSNLVLHSYCIVQRKWSVIFTATISQDLELFEAQCGVVVYGQWYQFGSIAKAGTVRSSLWKYSLEHSMWTDINQRGEIPLAEGGCMVSYNKNWLVFYGGYNPDQLSSVNNLYVFSVDAKCWYLCTGKYDFKLKSRQGSSMCAHKGRFYLFGGAYNGAEGVDYLNDFYEITIVFPVKGSPAKAKVREIVSLVGPEPRADHFMFVVDHGHLCLFGGSANQQAVTNLWAFDVGSQRWAKVADLQLDPVKRLGYGCAKESNSFYIFGGLGIDKRQEGLNDDPIIMSDLWSLSVKWPKSALSIADEYEKNCKLCFQNRNDFVQATLPFSSLWVDSIIETIEFPFAAMGLLVDNCLTLGATTVNICMEGPPTDYVLKIEDNGKIGWSEQEFVANLCCFQSQNNVYLIGTDKKVKRNIAKENVQRQFGINLKMGSLRWGSHFLYVCCAGQVVRVALCLKQEDSESLHQDYRVYYYSFHSLTKELIDEDRSDSRSFVEQSFIRYIRQALSNKKMTNTLYIFDTILNRREENVRVTEDSDVLFGRMDELLRLQQMGYAIRESIDISLRSYLSYLYLKNDVLSLSLGFNNQLSLIVIQPGLEKVDRLCRSKAVVDLESIIDFDFKVAELFCLRQMKKYNQFFSNGLLLYSKNRLIKRYKPKLGGVIPYILTQMPDHFNHLPLFGFAELPENVPVNVFKTDFVFSAMTEKLDSRIKFVDESVKARSVLWTSRAQANRARELREAAEQDEIIKKRSYRRRFIEESPVKQKMVSPRRGLDFVRENSGFQYRKDSRLRNSVKAKEFDPKSEAGEKFNRSSVKQE